MWVLDAWIWADKVWYPIVWEKIQDADNVVDYAIRPEQTKDTSAEINANNQTTTGMATVIPWVNAPKLLESTSIIKTQPTYFSWVINVLEQYSEDEDTLRYWKVISSAIWWNWIMLDDYYIVFKTKWVYTLNIEQQEVSSSVVSWYHVTTYVKKNWVTIEQWQFPYWPDWFVYSWPIEVSAWDTLGICWAIWNESTQKASAWQWPIYNISLTQI